MKADLTRALVEAADKPVSLRARWVFPVWGPPLENATLEITAGRISAVHDLPGPCTVDLGNAAIIPGLVNAHTHLELSDVSSPLQPALPFTSWLKTVIGHRRQRAQSASQKTGPGAASPAPSPVDRGLAEAADGGTTTIADITGTPSTAGKLTACGPTVVPFLEILGLSPDQQNAQLERARAHLATDPPSSGTCESSVHTPGRAHESSEPPGSSLLKTSALHPGEGQGEGALRGLSPHAPYSVHPDLLRRVVDLALEHRAPVAMHLAETRAELELLSNGTGEFVPFLESLGVWRPDAIARGTRPLDFLRELARVENALAIHGNYLSDEEIDFLAEHPNISVVYCPRTHAFFNHDPHTWLMLLDRGINVPLGTDSRASNPDLSLWGEVLYLHFTFPAVNPAEILRAATWNGAFALGREIQTGSLELGKSADLTLFALTPAAETSGDPYSLLLRRENQIQTTLIAGCVCA